MTTLHTAVDAKKASVSAQPLTRSPGEYTGTLDDLASRFILPNLPTADAVGEFHDQLSEYLEGNDALYLIRMMAGTERRLIHQTQDGTRFKATDNAPAWWIHAMLLQKHHIAPDAFAVMMATIPAHFHDVAGTCAPTANEAGWHIAHIFNVKDGDTDYARWRRAEVVQRCVRNIHPCNYFLLPKADWQRWGGDERVIGYFAALYADLYRAVWPAFLKLAGAAESALVRVSGEIQFAYGAAVSSSKARPPTSEARAPTPSSGDETGTQRACEYRASRLTFKRDVIEALALDDTFRVVTPTATFEMTRADFYRVFPRVRETRSYRDAGTYNYATLPKAADQFRVA